MSRSLPAGFRSFAHARSPGDEDLLLVRISHPDIDTLYFAENAKGTIESGGESYEGRSLVLPLPEDADGAVETSLELDLVGLDDDVVAALIDAEGERPEVEADLVLLSDPETVGATFLFQLKNAEARDTVLRGALSYEPILTEEWPGPVMDATRCPDLFP